MHRTPESFKFKERGVGPPCISFLASALEKSQLIGYNLDQAIIASVHEDLEDIYYHQTSYTLGCGSRFGSRNPAWHDFRMGSRRSSMWRTSVHFVDIDRGRMRWPHLRSLCLPFHKFSLEIIQFHYDINEWVTPKGLTMLPLLLLNEHSIWPTR